MLAQYFGTPTSTSFAWYEMIQTKPNDYAILLFSHSNQCNPNWGLKECGQIRAHDVKQKILTQQISMLSKHGWGTSHNIVNVIDFWLVTNKDYHTNRFFICHSLLLSSILYTIVIFNSVFSKHSLTVSCYLWIKPSFTSVILLLLWLV